MTWSLTCLNLPALEIRIHPKKRKEKSLINLSLFKKSHPLGYLLSTGKVRKWIKYPALPNRVLAQ